MKDGNDKKKNKGKGDNRDCSRIVGIIFSTVASVYL